MVADSPARPELHSELDGPIVKLDELTRSLLFAEISMIAYLDEADLLPLAEQLGFHEIVYVDRDGAQAYVLGNDHDRIVACRGTEPDEFNDLRADLNALHDVAETVGRVHRGFKREVDDLWPRLETVLEVDDPRDHWFTGHSLGGAMATICAGRCLLAEIPANPVGLFTYGSPRVGTKRYVDHAEVLHYRWVHNNDVVTRVPPTWLGYRHSGEIKYLDRDGVHREVTPIEIARDRSKGFWRGLRKRRIDHFSDHAIVHYVNHLARAVGHR